MKQYKHLFEFVYDILGYSPGGEYVNGVMTFNVNNITPTNFSLLELAFISYHEWFDESGLKEEKRLPPIKFALDFGPSPYDKMIENGYIPSQVGDTILWNENNEV